MTSVDFDNAALTSIGKDCFIDDNNLTRVNITDLKSWCETDFTNEYSNPIRISRNLYLKDELLEDVNIPVGTKEIKQYAFMYCNSFKTLNIPEGVTTIGQQAFFREIYLTKITLPSTLTGVDMLGFASTSRLVDVTCKALTPPENLGPGNIFDQYGNYNIIRFAKLRVMEESLDAYKEAWPWNTFKNIVEIEIEAGDANRDGQIDSQDVFSVINMVLGKETNGSKKVADVNGDGQIDSQDVYMIINKVLGK